ncbi:MAG: xanthine dehydrogenase family protein [Phycisphaerales bacterium]|nr:xanthine dehydrogenase family protein [Phycisphaerales bacterium]
MTPQDAHPISSRGSGAEQIPTRMPTANRPQNAGKTVNGDTSRLESVAKVTGAAKYGRDMQAPGMVWVRGIRCPWGNARLIGHDADAAKAVPGVVDVVVTGDTGEYNGDAVGYLLAENKLALSRGLRALRARWERLPCRTGIDAREAVLSVSDKAENALLFADHVLEAEYSTPVQTHSALETHGMMIDHQGDAAVVYASTQGTFAVADEIASFLSLPRNKFEVRCEHVGGGFGAKFQIGKEGAFAGNVASSLKRPVYSFCDRKEEHLDTGNRPSALVKVRVGFSKDGTVLGGQIGVWGGVGVATRGGDAAIPSGRYEFGVIERSMTNVSFNGGAPRAMRAPGHPQGAFAEELMLDEIATIAGVDPLELRIRLDKDETKARQAMYRLGAEMIGWKDRQPTGSQSGVVRRGFGVGSTSWRALRGPCDIEIAVHRDGSAELRTGTQDIGTGQRTACAVLAAERLSIPLELVSVAIGSSRLPNGPASGGSVTSPSSAPAVLAAAADAERQLMEIVAQQIGGAGTDYRLRNGKIVRGEEAVMGWNELCRRLPSESLVGRGTWDGRGSPYFQKGNSNGVQFVEVEVDSETGVVQVKRVIAFQACGRIICRKTAESQIIGGVIQGISYALFEDKLLDRQTGAMVNPNLEWYRILGANDMPTIEPVLWMDAEQTGVRGLGEPPVVPTAGAVAAAVFNAVGTPVRSLPIRPDRVLAAVEAAAVAGVAKGGAS